MNEHMQWTNDLPTPACAMVIAAHPDDAEFCAGATLAKWGAAGTRIVHVIITDGSKGTWDRHVDQRALIERRQQEQRAAGRVLSDDSHVAFLGLVDGDAAFISTTESMDLRRRIARLIREERPGVVVAHDPWKLHRLHPDHRVAGELAVHGVIAARDPFFHPELLSEGLEPHRPDALLLFEAEHPNHLETVSDRDADAKITALLCHDSQVETTHFHRVRDQLDSNAADVDAGRSPDDRAASEAAFGNRERELLRAGGQPLGVQLAEQFHLIVDSTLR